MRAIQITEFGGPEVLVPAELPDPRPRGDQLLLDVTAAGVNYADTHQAEDSYLAPQRLPLVPGAEVVGTARDGRRVVALVGSGGYAQRAVAAPAGVFDVPDAVTDAQALALVLQGLTAWHLLRTCADLDRGETVVVHAAAGGVGTIAIQLAKLWGAGRVIATASTQDKRDLATGLGADVAIPGDAEGLTDALVEANGGRQVDVVLEMVGGPVFDTSLAAVAPFGRLITYGTAGRVPPQPVRAGDLVSTSRAVIGFWLAHCFADERKLRNPMLELFSSVARGVLHPVIGGTYPMSEARRAHEDLRARRTTGKLVLDPSR